MDDMLNVTTAAAKVGGASIDLGQRILRGDELLIDAKVRIACVTEGRAIRMPVWVRDRLS
jgi:acyl-CoA thioester hydrolase